MPTATDKDTVRRDIFSVKVRCGNNGVNSPVHERMFYSLESARQYKREQRPASGYSIDKRIVHPKQWVVDGYLAHGNTIEP